MQNRTNSNKKIYFILVLAGIFVFFLGSVIADFFSINTKNTWYAFVCLCATLIPWFSAGMIFANRLRQTRPVLGMIIFGGLMLILISMVLSMLTVMIIN